MTKRTPMMAASSLKALIPAGLALLLLAGCAQPNSGRRAGLTAAQAAECRSRSEAIYRQQNRGEVYKSDIYATSTRDAPFATNGLPGITSNGLGAQFGREKALADCYNSQVNGPQPAAPQPPVVN
jgi:hypothetical protein